MTESSLPFVAFAGDRRVAAGTLAEVAAAAKPELERGEPVAIFDAAARPVDVDFRGSAAEVRARLEAPEPAARSPGRPRLGVVAREVTLLPRHWDWLATQPGGASVTLRRLVEAARRDADGAGRMREARDTAYRFMSAMAGDRPGFEEASRALFAGDAARFGAIVGVWPADIATHLGALAEAAFAAPPPAG